MVLRFAATRRVGWILCLWAWWWCIPATAWGQEVRDQERTLGSNTGNRVFRRAAEDQGRSDWPVKGAGRPGTAVRLTFDLRNADAVVVTDRSYGTERLVATLRRVAVEMGMPRADFLRVRDDVASVVDLEMNDHLTHPEARATAFDFDLARFAALLARTDLPRPVVLGIHPRHGVLNRVRLETASGTRPLNEIVFFGLDQVPEGARLLWRARVSASGWVVMGVLGAMLAVGMVVTWVRMWRSLRATPSPAPSDPPDPEEVQRRYDRARPQWWGLALVLPVGILLGSKDAVASMVLLLPQNALPGLAVGMTGGMLLPMVVTAWVRRRRGIREAPDPHTSSPAGQMGFLVGAMALMLSAMVYPMAAMIYPPAYDILRSGLRRLPSPVLQAMPLWLPLVAFAPGLLVAAWRRRRDRRPLPADDPLRLRAREIAEAAGVRVRDIVEVRRPDVNAAVNLGGTIVVTSALREKLPLDESVAVVAHEIGHLHGGHVRRSLVLGLGATAVLLALWWGAATWAQRRLPSGSEVRLLLSSPILGIFVFPVVSQLVLGRGQRAREEAADRFAAQAVGDPEIVVRALVRLHTLAAVPHRLKAADEALHTHPSLDRRIAALRRLSEPPPS